MSELDAALVLAAVRGCQHHSILMSSEHGTIQSAVDFRMCLDCGASRDSTRDWVTPWIMRLRPDDPEKAAAQERAIESVCKRVTEKTTHKRTEP